MVVLPACPIYGSDLALPGKHGQDPLYLGGELS
jgi:hypothetical protein